MNQLLGSQLTTLLKHTHQIWIMTDAGCTQITELSLAAGFVFTGFWCGQGITHQSHQRIHSFKHTQLDLRAQRSKLALNGLAFVSSRFVVTTFQSVLIHRHHISQRLKLHLVCTVGSIGSVLDDEVE